MVSPLKRGYSLLKQRRYKNVISLLEPQIPIYRENARFYYLLGRACLMTNDLGGADLYLKRGLKCSGSYTLLTQTLAVVYLKKRNATEAIRIWLGLLDDNPYHFKAKLGLKRIRKSTKEDLLNQFLYSKKPYRYLPFLPLSLKTFAPFLLLLPLVVAGYIGIGYLFKRFEVPAYTRGQLTELSLTEEEERTPTAFTGSYTLMFSPQEVLDIYNSIINYYNIHQDNYAMREINRILLSNASVEIKEKARGMKRIALAPEIDSFDENFPYRDVVGTPELYSNCYVLWRGRISNYRVEEGKIEFDLLVGYETGQVLEGVVPVVLDFPIDLMTDLPIRVLGKVMLKSESLSLKGAAIHQFLAETGEEES